MTERHKHADVLIAIAGVALCNLGREARNGANTQINARWQFAANGRNDASNPSRLLFG